MTATEATTAQHWDETLVTLRAKQESVKQHVEQLAAQKRDIALESAMGSVAARKQSKELAADLARLAAEADDLGAAITAAEGRKAEAQRAEAEHGERERRRQISALLKEYLADAEEIDRVMEQLSQRFTHARGLLDGAQRLATGDEQAPLNQLRSQFGATMACGHHGLGAFLDLGRSTHTPHKQPLSAYVRAYVGGWIEPTKKEVA